MHLLFVSNLFPTPSEPDRGVFSLQLVKALQPDIKVSVVCPLPWFPSSRLFRNFGHYYQMGQVPAQYRIDGVDVFSAKYPLIPKISENIHPKLMRLGLAKVVKRIHARDPIDVINSHWIYPDSVAIEPLAKAMKIPHLATGLGCDINHDLFAPGKGGQILNLLQSADHISTVSSDLKRVCVEKGIDAKKITPILNGVDTDKFRLLDRKDSRQQLAINQHEKILLYVGRLSEEKNVLNLLEAFSQLESDDVVKLHLIGDGPLRQPIEAFIHSNNLSSKVVLHGHQPHHKVALYLGACNWFCLPSIREGCPNVVLESLASGRPVLGSRVGAIPDLVDEKKGLLFDPNSIEDMALKISDAINVDWNEPEIEHSMKELSWRAIAGQYKSVFSTLLNN